MRRVVVLAILFASLPTALAADGLDDFIGAELARRRIPGLALAVLRQGQPLALRAYGLASVELAVPVTAGTVTDRETRYYTFAVTDDERLADLRLYTE